MKQIFTATEARQNFFEILKIVEKGKEAIIVKKDEDKRFKLILAEKEKQPNKVAIVKKMGKIGLKTMSVRKMKEIISTLHDIDI